MHDTATLVPEKEPLAPTGQETVWTLELVWTMKKYEKSLSPPGTDVQPIL
jgi:hypothetical protein